MKNDSFGRGLCIWVMQLNFPRVLKQHVSAEFQGLYAIQFV